MIKLLQTVTFKKKIKKLHLIRKTALDAEIKKIVTNPEIGMLKKGDLAGIRVHKFKILTQLYLLAYRYNNESILLLALGSHQNFYDELKRN